MALLDVQGNPVRRLILECDISERRKAANIIGASPLKGGKWSYPADELVVQLLQHNFEESLDFTTNCLAWYQTKVNWRQQLYSYKEGTQDVARKISWWDTLKDYQQNMVTFGTAAKRFINGDDRGLGKTLEALSVAENVGARKVLVVCPGYLKTGWQREIWNWLNEVAYVANGDRAAREAMIQWVFDHDDAKYLIVNYEMLREKKSVGGYPELLEHKWDAIIYDEAHRLKGRKSQWVEGANKLSKVPCIQMLTGNPLDKPEDIWSLLHILDPLKFSSFWAFVEYFCTMADTFFGKEIIGVNRARLGQLQYELLPYLMRRKKEEVAPELPLKEYHPIYVELEGPQATFYNRLEKQAVIELSNGELDVMGSIVAKQTRLAQAIANPAILGGKDCSIIEKTCLELISDIFDSSDKVIVGTWFVPAAELLRDKLINAKYAVYYVHAGLKSSERDKVIENFKASKMKSVLVGTIRSMSEGLNIDECDHMIFCDKDWTPLNNEQFEDRIHRITSTRTKHYYDIIVQHTVSEDKRVVLADRTQVRDEVLSMQAVAKLMMRRNGGDLKIS